jgi:hypothetical protein
MTFITRTLPTISTSACLVACVGIVELRGQISLSATISSAKPSTALYVSKATCPEITNPPDATVNARIADPSTEQHTFTDAPR